MNPWLNWSTTVLSMALASLAKSRSLISITGTETMAKASLSSLVGHVPNCRRSILNKTCNTLCFRGTSSFIYLFTYDTILLWTHLESHFSCLIPAECCLSEPAEDSPWVWWAAPHQYQWEHWCSGSRCWCTDASAGHRSFCKTNNAV